MNIFLVGLISDSQRILLGEADLRKRKASKYYLRYAQRWIDEVKRAHY